MKISAIPKVYSWSGVNRVVVLPNGQILIATESVPILWDGSQWFPLDHDGCHALTSNPKCSPIIWGAKSLKIVSSESNGICSTISIIDSTKLLTDTLVDAALRADGSILVATSSQLLSLKKPISVMDTTSVPISIFYADNPIIYSKQGEGLFSLSELGSAPKLIEGSTFLATANLLYAYPFGSGVIAITASYPWVQALTSSTNRNAGNITNYLNKNSIIVRAYHSFGEVYILTNCNTVFILNEEGEVKSSFNPSHGIDSERIVDIHPNTPASLLILTPTSVWVSYRTELMGYFPKSQVPTTSNIPSTSAPWREFTRSSVTDLGPTERILLGTLPGSIIPLEIADVVNEFEKEDLAVASLLYSYESTYFFLHQFVDHPQVSSIWMCRYIQSNPDSIRNTSLGVLPSSLEIKRAYYTPDSTLWLSTTHGLYYFSANENYKFSQKPSISIQWANIQRGRHKVYLRNGSYTRHSNTLASRGFAFNSFSVSLSSVGCSQWGLGLGSVMYSTKIKGYDQEWTNWTKRNMREVSHLKPGNYTLLAKSRNVIGEESNALTLPFTVAPMLHQLWYIWVALFLWGLLALYAFYRWRQYYHSKEHFNLESIITRRTEELVVEKEKTDNLLARVLPKETAIELKESGKVETKRYQMVTVLFSDIVGFTRITEETNPESLLDQLDKFFLYFDSVVERYQIEKIKTIGDAYMCAGGIPKKNRTNPVEVVLAALEMMQYMKHITHTTREDENFWGLRIGIDTGPVIAGVVGRNKLSYDIWGSTVNTASRVESSGQTGHINISGNTYMLVNEFFICSYRGKMPVKNRGDIPMYFVNGIKPSLSVEMKGVKPNHEFHVHLQLIRLGDLEDFILMKLEDGLPKNLYYHNLKHTVDVYTQVELIGRSENVSNEEMLLLRTAALFHDSGHLVDYSTHEEMGVKLAREILPEFQYNEKQIESICELIMCTKLPPKPKNLLEAVMCDADLDYLGRTDFIPVSETLYKEFHEQGLIGSLVEWNKLQIKFIEQHSYFTNTARRLRNVNKQSQLDKLKAWLEKNEN